ncbi:MAG: glutathione S-transferase family protein [Silicimonas sp.]|nr:glutathione S-transferase family protein [Silicimonas sp.]
MSLEIIGGARSRAFRVLWLAEELGLDYRHLSEAPHSALVSALNPLGQIPILRDDDVVLTDSLAILHYLADRADRFTFPTGTPERALMDARINFVLTELEAPLWMAARHSFVLPEDRRHPEIKPWLKDDFRDAGQRFTRLLDGAQFLAGDTFTIADIVAGHTIGWSIVAKFDPSDELKAYLRHLSDRPAWQRARAD